MEAARKEYEEAVKIYRELAEKNPSAPLYFAFEAPGSQLARSLKERIQFRYRSHFFLHVEPRFELPIRNKNANTSNN